MKKWGQNEKWKMKMKSVKAMSRISYILQHVATTGAKYTDGFKSSCFLYFILFIIIFSDLTRS